MNETQILLSYIEEVLGKGTKTSRTNYAFKCPFCTVPHKKPKLEVDLDVKEERYNRWNCWVCRTRGQTLLSLYRKIGVDRSKYLEIKPYIKKVYFSKVNDLESLSELKLPKESLNLFTQDSLECRRAKSYLKKRGISDLDIVKYNIKYCETGKYAGRVVIPSYDANGKLNYYIARDYTGFSGMNYLSPVCDKDNIIGFELFINWKLPVILCEGVFDAIAIKRNVIPLFGKTIPTAVMKKIVTSEVKEVYIILDRDAESEMLEYTKDLLDLGKVVYTVELEGKDPSLTGFNHMVDIINHAEKMTYGRLIQKKLEYYDRT